MSHAQSMAAGMSAASPGADLADVRDAVRALGRFAATQPAPTPGTDLAELLHRTLLDTLGVVVAGAQTSELRALRQAWALAPGPSRVLGAGQSTSVESAAYLNGVASVCLELDEGNKYARGHPAAHVLPAALALAQALHAPGEDLAAAVLVGHEVASRFGRATRLHSAVHPHGNWGIAGGAAACARLLRLDAEQTAAAIDAASASVTASPWPAATEGDQVRDAWMGAAAVASLAAARLAAAGLARTTGLAASSLGTILGTFDASQLTQELGARFDLGSAYFKRHASCSYTHPSADALLDLLARYPELQPSEVLHIDVETYPIAARLDSTRVPTRLAAMFSIPYVIATALVERRLTPDVFDERHRSDPTIARLAQATRVEASQAFANRLPHERGARVTLTLVDGRQLSAEVPNPVGDTAYFPFGLPEVRAKLAGLLPTGWTVERFEELTRRLLDTSDVAEVLEAMP